MDTEISQQERIVRLKLAANSYCDSLAWPTVLLAALTGVGYFSVPLLAMHGVMSIVWASLLMALITYAAYTPLHEAVHGAVCGGRARYRWVNEAVGYLAGLVSGIPLTAHRHEHFAHHAHTNIISADPDLLCAGMTDNWRALVTKPIGMIANQYRFFVRERWHAVSQKDRLVFLIETLTILASRLLLLTLMITAHGASNPAPWWHVMLSIGSLLIVGPALGVILLVYLFAFIVHHPHHAVGKFVDTSVFEPPATIQSVITWLWGCQNYHGVHHAFPRVPWYRYRALFDDHKAAIVGLGIPVHHLQRARWVPANY